MNGKDCIHGFFFLLVLNHTSLYRLWGTAFSKGHAQWDWLLFSGAAAVHWKRHNSWLCCRRRDEYRHNRNNKASIQANTSLLYVDVVCSLAQLLVVMKSAALCTTFCKINIPDKILSSGHCLSTFSHVHLLPMAMWVSSRFSGFL